MIFARKQSISDKKDAKAMVAEATDKALAEDTLKANERYQMLINLVNE